MRWHGTLKCVLQLILGPVRMNRTKLVHVAGDFWLSFEGWLFLYEHIGWLPCFRDCILKWFALLLFTFYYFFIKFCHYILSVCQKRLIHERHSSKLSLFCTTNVHPTESLEWFEQQILIYSSSNTSSVQKYL